IEKSEVERVRKRFDKRRAGYYYANTTRKWNDYNNYDIMLDSSVLGIDGCVAVLKGLLSY
ncbi:MAG: cytidylate kinase-like family protein, partial [Acetatifactor sp.]